MMSAASFWSERPPLSASVTLSPQETVLALWRQADLGPAEKALKSGTQAASQVVPKVLQKLGIDKRRSEAEIARVWNNLIDPLVTAHAQPSGLAKGTLFVTVNSHVWLDDIIRFRRREILQRLQHSFGKEMVKKISFRVG